jgi:hypothetical protein
MRSLILAALALIAVVPLDASTINNNDSCDIGTYPAATLLLQYFEVDLSNARSQTTLFSVTNVSPVPQIANVTIWTDWAFPVISFPLFLTGYDVQPINLYDVIGSGLIAPPNGTSVSAPNARDPGGHATNPLLGTQPMTNLQNPNFFNSVATDCAGGRLPGQIPATLSTDIRALLTTGRSTGAMISCPLPNGTQARVGGDHGGVLAIGYVTIDVVATCSPIFATDPHYWDEILFDNVLTGDYQQIASDSVTGNYAGGNPMVHIRAVQAPLPFTFYDRYTKLDRRQPLPSTFAARWISGSNSGFDTQYKIWREGATGIGASCESYLSSGAIPLAEIVRFDERENAGIFGSFFIDPPILPATSATSRLGVANSIFPTVPGSSDLGGWTYFNLNNGNARGVSQNWVTVSMFAEGRFGVEADATSLGNGCSPASPLTTSARDENSTGGRIGPAKNP